MKRKGILCCLSSEACPGLGVGMQAPALALAIHILGPGFWDYEHLCAQGGAWSARVVAGGARRSLSLSAAPTRDVWAQEAAAPQLLRPCTPGWGNSSPQPSSVVLSPRCLRH